MLAGAPLADGAELTVGLNVRVIKGAVLWLLGSGPVGMSSSPLDEIQAIVPVVERPGLLADLVEEGLSAHIQVSQGVCHQSNG